MAQLAGLEEAQEASQAIDRGGPHGVSSNTTTSSEAVTAGSADNIEEKCVHHRGKGVVTVGRVDGPCDIRRSAGCRRRDICQDNAVAAVIEGERVVHRSDGRIARRALLGRK